MTDTNPPADRAPLSDAELALIRTADAMDRVTEAGRRSPAVHDRGRLLAEVDRLMSRVGELEDQLAKGRKAVADRVDELEAEIRRMKDPGPATFGDPQWDCIEDREIRLDEARDLLEALAEGSPDER